MNTEILRILLIEIGLIFLLYGLYNAFVLRKALKTGKVKEAWDTLSVFIIFFILGYVGQILNLAFDIMLFDPLLLEALVFFAGGMFVAITAYVNRNAIAGQ